MLQKSKLERQRDRITEIEIDVTEIEMEDHVTEVKTRETKR